MPEFPNVRALRESTGLTRRAASDDARRTSAAQDLMRLGATGTEFAFTAVGGGVLGWLLDRWLGTSPWMLVAFAFVGVGAAFWRLIRSPLIRRGNATPRR
jgi:ATP synthase protein I